MIYTARQLQDLHKGNANGQLVLPYGARLTPLAADWAKSKKIAVGYSDVEVVKTASAAMAANVESKPVIPATAGALLWRCDDPCGAAKAAIAAHAQEANQTTVDFPV